ncbi:HAD family hydrolase [Candidatus Marsarchaeota archaeon]|nr:HAD family hydrolase [Candidatus Marsarchaeota archaeon]
MANPSDISHRFDTFIFDWDGTLNSPTLVNHPIWLTFKKSRMMSELPADEEEIKSAMKHAFFGKAKKEFDDMEITTFVRLADIFFSLLKPRFHKGAREFLEKLNSSGKKTALFTDGSLKRVYVEMKHLNAFNYFDIILSAQSLKRIKPDPTGLKVIAKILDVDRDRCIYFGDRKEDILAAKRAGMGSAAMLNGFSSETVLLEAHPDFKFKSMEEALAAFEKNR